MAMHSAAILARENKELKAANAKQKRKQEKHCTYISQGEGLTVEQGMDHIQRGKEVERGVVELEEQPQKHTAPQCSVCGVVGHTACTCSQHTGNHL